MTRPGNCPGAAGLVFVLVNYFCGDRLAGAIASIVREFAVAAPGESAPGSIEIWPVEILIVNNSVGDRSLEPLRDRDGQNREGLDTLPITILEAGENLGFGRACNLAIAQVWQRDFSQRDFSQWDGLQRDFSQRADRPAVTRPIVWLLNPDAWLAAGTGSQFRQFCAADRSQPWPILGTIVREPDGSIAFAGGGWDRRSGRIHPQTELARPVTDQPVIERPVMDRPDQPMDLIPTAWVSGCSLILNLPEWQEQPYFDRDFFLYYEDFDFCRRWSQAGYAVAIAPGLTVYHATSSITGRQPDRQQAWAIAGYLLALQKRVQAGELALGVWLYRLLRIGLSTIGLGWVKPRRSWAKLRGLLAYGRVFGRSLIRSLKRSVIWRV